MTTIRQFSGDIRLWGGTYGNTLIPVNEDDTDPDGNVPVEAESFNVSYTEGDSTSIKSRRRGDRYNQTIYQQTLPGSSGLSIKLNEVPAAIVALMVYGVAANGSVAAAAVAETSYVVPQLGVPIKLPDVYLAASPAPTVKDADDVLLTSGTDYVIDRRRGTLLVKGGITDGDSVKVAYSRLAVTSTKFACGATPSSDFYITGDLEDRNSGDQGLMEVYQVKLKPDGDIDWLSTDPISVTLTGEMVVPAGKSAPYTFDLYRQAA